jgi:hypothetical protein
MPPKMPNLIVYRGPCATGAYTWSPFVAKLETRLRFSHKKYSTQVGSLSESPKGKLPYILIEDETPVLISDSTLIIRTLVESGMMEDLNADLTPAQTALDLAIRALLEDKLYFMTVSVFVLLECSLFTSPI